MPDRPDVITVRDLVKTFGSLTAVNSISFSVRKGEVFGILGPNGAGKTTAMECIEGLQKPTSGAIQVLGMDVPRQAQQVKQRIGVQLQASAYFEYLTLREVLVLFGRFYEKTVKPEQLLQTVGLVEKARSTVGKLSGGQKQRFAVAATLVNDPEVVFLDEPTTGLDPRARRDLWELVQSIHAKGNTIVLTTHYMEEAEFLCDRVAIMDRGNVVALDSPENLVRTLPAPYEITVGVLGYNGDAQFGGLAGVLEAKRSGGGLYVLRSANAATTLPALLAWAGNAGASVGRLEVKPANLEDVFLAKTGRAIGPEEVAK